MNSYFELFNSSFDLIAMSVYLVYFFLLSFKNLDFWRMETKLERKLIQHIFIENISQPMTSAYKEVIVLDG